MTESSFSYEIHIDDLDKALAGLDRFDPIATKHLTRAMEQSVKNLEASVKPFVPVGVSGRLRNSIGSEVITEKGSIVGRVGSSLKGEVYPRAVEFGSKPHFPPPSALVRWVHLKLGVPDKDAYSVAYRIARKISKVGTKPVYYLRQGWKKATPQTIEYFKLALRAIAKELTHGA